MQSIANVHERVTVSIGEKSTRSEMVSQNQAQMTSALAFTVQLPRVHRSGWKSPPIGFRCSVLDDFKIYFMHINEGRRLSVGLSRIDTVIPYPDFRPVKASYLQLSMAVAPDVKGVFPGNEASISILECKVSPFGTKLVHLSVNLPDRSHRRISLCLCYQGH